jgi:protein transport protein SEC61 subunit gamma-like protein
MEEEQPQNTESQTGGELPQNLEQQPTQMFIAKKRDEEKFTEKKSSRKEKFKRFLVECRRVLKVTKKPDKFEFTTIVKVSGLGMAVIGIVGFIISLIKELLL